MTCKWNGRGNPRTIPGRHIPDCASDACPGCQPCEDARLCRILQHVETDEAGCWVSDLTLNRDGYSTIRLRPDPVPKLVHRVTYELLVGPIPKGLVIDHLCRNRACCNPTHLEPVTTRVNNLRGIGFPAVHAAQTHCVNGHEFTPENTRIRTRSAAGRDCKKCNTIRARDRRRRKATA